MHSWKLSFQKTVKQSPLRFIVSVAVFVISSLLLWSAYIHIVEWHFFHSHYASLQNEAASKPCQIPMPDPFDESVMKYVVKKGPMECKFIQPELTYIDYEGVVHINQSAIVHHNLTEQLSCSYRTFKRKEKNDNNIVFDTEMILNESVKIIEGREFISVTCKHKEKTIYYNFHMYIHKEKNGTAVNSKSEPYKPQVLIFVIESMSRLNMIRHMPKSYSYLTTVMNSDVLKGLTKVADNSFPNMIALLTGRKVRMDPQELPGSESDGPYDDWPFIWKNFSNIGYVTALLEDDPVYTMLNYLAKGCLDKPTDYYPRPFWLALWDSPLHKLSSEYCAGNIPTFTIMFEWMKEFIIKHTKELYFLFSFYIAVTHVNFNNAQYLDNDVYQMFKHLNEEGHFENAIVIVMGDHGNRYGGVLTTSVGLLEERMPLFSISIPSALAEQHPHLRAYLQKNSERLTTWLDVHSMLTDVVKSTYHQAPPSHVWNTRGYSAWRMEIPLNRSCKAAGVPDNYCVCQREVEIPQDDSKSVAAANKLVDHLNYLLETVKPFCVTLSLKKILHVSVLFPSQPLVKKKEYALRLRTIVALNPSDAVVEALMQKSTWSSEYEMVGDASRLNKYGNQSACINHREMKKFCLCKEK